MKLINVALAGMSLGTKHGALEVGADGTVEVSDEEVIAALKISGFKPEEESNSAENKPKSRQDKQVAQEKKEEPEVVAVEKEAEEESDEIEIEDLADYPARDAMEMVKAEGSIDILEAWKDSESDGKNRKTVIKTLDERIAEVR